ncbi:MAG: GNAT family N-acetyltransferase [Verrucomicrobia bacterium]|nr:GNAT family N-acetyltransferase [Verrucomicrobiota bacterium]MCH8512381.1 GNAT family N-acetyltransferase [Kiritimatiellia bacterium]
MIQNTPHLEIAPVTGSAQSELLDLYVSLFHDREPLTKLIGLGRERMRSLAESMHGRKPQSENLCWMARDAALENRPVAFVVCDDPTLPGAETLPDNLTDAEQETVAVVGGFLSEIRRPLPDLVAWEPGVCMHVAALGVAPGYEGQGLATRLLQTALGQARLRGFRHVFAECTGPASRMCHEKCGFACVHSVSADTFAYQGVFPFSGNDLVVDLMLRKL